jgi:hypothetical protein
MKIEDYSDKIKISENDKLEYQEAIKLWQDDSRLRRQGLTFSATFQGIIMAVLSKGYGDNPIIFISLATLAMFVSLLSLNNDRRLSCYMGAYEARLIEIEKENSLSLVHKIIDVAKKRTPFLTNEVVFGTFFTTLAIGWGVSIILRFWTIFK